MRIGKLRATIIILGSAVFVTQPGLIRGQEIVSQKQHRQDSAGFSEFSDRVLTYVKLHNMAEAKLPPLKPTDLPELILAHQQALARKIREGRPNAKAGEIFAHGSREAFRHAIRATLDGPQSPHARATIKQSKQGARVKEMHLKVNDGYPDALPYTTVPPSLLLEFPQLPDQVAYRIVGRDLILLDVKANLVIDLIPEIFPIGFGSST